MRTPDFFPGSKPPRAKPRVLMHVSDGMGFAERGEGGSVRWKCKKCGHESRWVDLPNLTATRRGEPCPHCNSMEASNG